MACTIPAGALVRCARSVVSSSLRAACANSLGHKAEAAEGFSRQRSSCSGPSGIRDVAISSWSREALSHRSSLKTTSRQLHTSSAARRRQDPDTSSAAPKQETTASDLDRLDVLGAVPVPSHSVDLCMADGFQLNSGAEIRGGSGVLLVGGEGFAWQPWLAGDKGKRLVNSKGQWDIPDESLALLGLVWPRPDILILGLGPEIRPLAPAVRKHIASLGMRVDVMDTHNAAAQFNMLVRERGIDEIAAALIPLGWREGRGAGP
ncbi:hypothetical protein Micbo1qcDRAFT_159864 [Microdochium bolleyi]|uniref:NADH dehydrogenase [ubiquinone] 1 alpha subcomplex assembly factor 3 n=1 Tax=Microdochium bolleyi TaxID=196109 RepID=A0A136JBX7_9PEZI|nr:hypothetical protein Micbo1qcDRAFT_159864 [Microdochium bolleyi]